MRALVILCALVAATRADPLGDAIARRAGADLPPELAVVAVHVPRSVARRAPAADTIAVEWPRAPRVGRMSVRLRAGRRDLGFVPVTIAARVAGFTAVRDLAAGDRIGTADVVASFQIVPAGRVAAEVAIGATVTAAIAAGELVDRDRIALPPPIPRDTEVEVVVRGRGYAIRSRGRLLASARVGEVAIVRAADGPQLRGTLIDHQVVVIEEAP